ncbi:MAG: hypothetical protein ACRDO2_06490 [Nocardioidaceae bacterium]
MSEVRDQVREQLVDVLMGRIESDLYPSTTMLNLIEELITEDELPAYAAVLLDKVSQDQFPSIPMLDRLHRLV